MRGGLRRIQKMACAGNKPRSPTVILETTWIESVMTDERARPLPPIPRRPGVETAGALLTVGGVIATSVRVVGRRRSARDEELCTSRTPARRGSGI
jgi:hypothetical protein